MNEVKRPTLRDPAEWKIIHKMYFEPKEESVEQEEQRDRQESKAKQQSPR